MTVTITLQKFPKSSKHNPNTIDENKKLKHPARNQLTMGNAPQVELQPQSSAYLRSMSGVIDENGLRAHLTGASDEDKGLDSNVASIPQQNSTEFSGGIPDTGLWAHLTGVCDSGRGVEFIPNLDSVEFSGSTSDNGLWAHLTGIRDEGREMDDTVALIRDRDSIELSGGVSDEVSNHLQGGRGDDKGASNPGLISSDSSSTYSRSLSGEVDENGLWKALVADDSGVSDVEFIPDIRDED